MIEQGAYSSQTAGLLNDVPYPHQVSLIDVATQLAYRKWLIAAVTGVALISGVTIGLVSPVRYTATTKIMPPQQNPSSASLMMNQLATIGAAGSLAAVAG